MVRSKELPDAVTGRAAARFIRSRWRGLRELATTRSTNRWIASSSSWRSSVTGLGEIVVHPLDGLDPLGDHVVDDVLRRAHRVHLAHDLPDGRAPEAGVARPSEAPRRLVEEQPLQRH